MILAAAEPQGRQGGVEPVASGHASLAKAHGHASHVDVAQFANTVGGVSAKTPHVEREVE